MDTAAGAGVKVRAGVWAGDEPADLAVSRQRCRDPAAVPVHMQCTCNAHAMHMQCAAAPVFNACACSSHVMHMHMHMHMHGTVRLADRSSCRLT